MTIWAAGVAKYPMTNAFRRTARGALTRVEEANAVLAAGEELRNRFK